MKKLFFLLSIFAIVLSCSSDETSTPVTPPPAPIAKYTITLSAGEGGTVSTTGGEYEAGQTVSVTATPQGEYVFTSWSDGNTDATRTITVSSNNTLAANFEKRKYPLTVNFEGEGEVIEEIVNAGRTTDYDSGTTVKLTAQAAAEWIFVGWTGDIESTEESVQVVIGEPKEVTATFEKKKYPLSVNIEGEGEVIEEIIEAGRTTEYDSGTIVKLTAEPEGEWLFIGWSGDIGDIDPTENPIQLTIIGSKTVTATFEKKKYPLTINIEGEGEVLEEIVNSGRSTDYSSGTTVKLTAIPAEGWSVFKKWSGSVNSTETSIEINISEPTTINAVFEESNFIVTKNKTRIEVEGVVLEDIRATFSDVSGSFYYTHNGNEYFFNSGNRWISGELWNTSLDPQSLPKIPHLILKKFDNKWLLDQVHRVSATRLVRNPVKYGNQLIIADAGEIGNNADLWLGDAWIGELVPDNIEWRKINPDGEKTFWHGVTAGDINGDGLTDIGGVPAPDYRLYVQNQDGTFSNQRNIWSYSDSNDSPFTIAFIDVDGDGRDEIITADYGEQNQNQLNNVQTYKYNDKNERFERIFVSNEPEAFYSLSECPNGLGGTSIKASDFNNDGNIDISVAREDSCGSAFEVWLGDGNGEFKPHWSNFFRGTDLQNWREFKLMDVNNDNNMDIVLRPDGYGSLFRISPVQYDPVASGGVKLNNSIWINDGQGNFSAYENKELEIKDVFVDFLEPFMKDGILHFIGTTTLPDDAHYGEDAITLSIYDIKVRIE